MYFFDQLAGYLTNASDHAPWLLLGYLALIGGLLASFGGLVIDRLPHQLEWVDEPDPKLTLWSPRSRCDQCGRRLRILEMVPVLGWFVARGRCGNCLQSVSRVYPLSELGMAVAFPTIFVFVPGTVEALILMLFAWVGFVISMIDLRHHWIPAVITTPMLWLGLLASPFEADVFQRVVGAAAAGGVIWVSFFLVSILTRRPLLDMWSGGDVAFLMMAGAWFGVEAVICLIFLGSVFFICHERTVYYRTGERWVPFGPSLSAAFLIVAALEALGVGLHFA
ncbi:prepilin peptidase [Salipiger mucosus]|uniref:Prepilin peptidase n=1 Tax=Salipiger mucosus DSM 16094 TaxID=1123237 RepID=S9QWN7_9RHOB|nr:A24 family peptidase [Salipiger mucosus]EPX83997.1 hypothetical protein Salmuc_01772 [Salipiger mucosus DSM 16094]